MPVYRAPIQDTLFLINDVLGIDRYSHLRAFSGATPDMVESDKLLLLEEGHCFRDQTLTFCGLRQIENAATFGVSSLTTLLEMVANGFGMTLIPEISVELETKRENIHLMRFENPEPKRVIGLAWRKSSPRRNDFVQLGKIITATREQQARKQIASHNLPHAQRPSRKRPDQQ